MGSHGERFLSAGIDSVHVARCNDTASGALPQATPNTTGIIFVRTHWTAMMTALAGHFDREAV
ncbi:hypothetical protein Hrd1104_10165 [Halorhabdus sp. CBA1104]|uniref:hypothetical protein n=1 Tax=Halorhabdus sp. CBA1104 TaxID=1380432 RepID=UPI0012B4042B|nr:hypothetical protein [Halorhabdus sp. CBA1104]QGN07627.1 hypothetical protein Hrd1104_10165 [Halorhabdus sp. CBA1104]